MAAPARQWADIYVADTTERYGLEARALFYVPAALPALLPHGFNTSRLAAISSTSKVANPNLAGRSAIGNALNADQPVIYKSATGFIQVVNLALEGAKSEVRLTLSDIVACVFRLRDGAEVAEDLKVSASDIAVACKIPLAVAEAALAKYRLSYIDAQKIWTFLYKVKTDSKASSKAIDEVLTDKMEDLIKTDVRADLPMSIKKTRDGHVYRAANLTPAPRNDHFWAIDKK